VNCFDFSKLCYTVMKVCYLRMQCSSETSTRSSRCIPRHRLSLCIFIFHQPHHWLDSPMWAVTFLRSFCQLKLPAIASSDFVTSVFSRVGLSAPRPTPGYPGRPMFSVRVVSLSWLVPILKRQDLSFCPCMTYPYKRCPGATTRTCMQRNW
jgi:hypothetical protein